MNAKAITLTNESGAPVAPRTSASLVSLLNGKSVEQALGGCWIDFTDADGNPTDKPYIHWVTEESAAQS